MARIELDPVLQALCGNMRELRGTLSKSKNGTRVVAKTYKNGQVRVYFMQKETYERSTAPSAAELANRQRFAITSRIYKFLRAQGDVRSRKELNAAYYHLPLSELERLEAALRVQHTGNSVDIVSK